MNLLLISNSTMAGGEYLTFPMPFISDFLGTKPLNLLFIPYAAVSFSFDEYEKRIQTRFAPLGHHVVSIHHSTNPIQAVEEADGIIIGGGNTWQLVHHMHEQNIMEPIRRSVTEKNIPYIGWSAGSNVACPTLMTTNDMPIIDPISFNTLNLVPFQINAHYTDKSIEGHGGETRDTRINEFIIANPKTTVVGLREGQIIEYKNQQYTLFSIKNPEAKIFHYGKEAYDTNDINSIV